MKNIFIPLLATIAFITAVGLYTQKKGVNIPLSIQTPLPLIKQVDKKEITSGNTKIQVEVARSDSERKKGLSGRSFLPENDGMLFVFDQKNVFPSFWMKNTLIPLDIIWIKGGKITKIDKNIQPPAKNTPDSQLLLYHPDKPIDYVLEVNRGFSDKNNIKVGNSIDLSEI